MRDVDPAKLPRLVKGLLILAGRIMKASAPSWRAELDELKRLPARDSDGVDDGDSPEEREADIDRLRQLLNESLQRGAPNADSEDMDGVAELVQQLSNEAGLDAADLEGSRTEAIARSLYQDKDDPGFFTRNLRWAFLLTRYRYQILNRYAKAFGPPRGTVSAHALWQEIADLPLSGKFARLSDATFRSRLLAARPEGRGPFAKIYFVTFDKMFVLGDPPNYEPLQENSIGAQARRRGMDPALLALEHMESGGGKGLIYYPLANYAEGWLEPSLEMMKHPDTVMGLSDGGAHVGTICDASFPTTMLTHWTRDRSRGPKLPLPWAIQAYSSEAARAVGLRDRGVLKVGYRADINVIDYDRLSLCPPEIRFDLPAGGRRLLQRAEGYDVTILAGQVTYRSGKSTGALPGRLVRGEQAAP